MNDSGSAPAHTNPRHLRIQRRSGHVFWVNIAVFVLTLLWLISRFTFCWGDTQLLGDLMCRSEVLAPPLLLVVVLLVAAMSIDLYMLGREQSGMLFIRHARRTYHGYQQLEPTHRKHVRRSLIAWILVLSGFLFLVLATGIRF